MSKFVELIEAAKMLGMTPDELMELRQRGEIHGYRDGGSWKFKPDEVERVKAERAAGGGAGDSEYDLAFDHLMPGVGGEDEASSELDSVSILVSDESLGQSPPTSSSTIIGKKKDGEKAADSDIKLADESKAGSGLGMLDAGSSDLQLAGDSGVLGGKEAQLKSPESGGTGELQLASDGPPGIGSDALSLDNELDLGDGALSLGEDSDDLVLGGSGIGSDVSLDPGGSGINIAKPTDSGLSLEEPLELGGSQVESLELPEDEEVFSMADVASDPDQATMLKQDEEFALSPVADLSAEDSSDSGSQVIALEDSEAFDEASPTMLGAADEGVLLQEAPVADAQFGFGEPAGGPQFVAQGMQQPQAQPQQFAPAPQEAPYSIFNVLSLLAVFMVMGLTGALMIDVLRNMWAFDSSATLSTSIMDMIIDSLKM